MAKAGRPPKDETRSRIREAIERTEAPISMMTALRLTDPVLVYDRVGQIEEFGKYSNEIHAELCRMKLLGMSNQTAAQAVGISPSTLSKWIREIPQLESDLEQCAAIALSEVSKRLFQLMDTDGPTAFQAVRLFLTTRSEEFREKSEITTTHVNQVQMGIAIRQIYGIRQDGDDDENPTEQPVLDAANPPLVLADPSQVANLPAPIPLRKPAPVVFSEDEL